MTDDIVTRLRGALKPFSADEWSEAWLDASSVTIDVTLGAIRRAKLALNETESEQ